MLHDIRLAHDATASRSRHGREVHVFVRCHAFGSGRSTNLRRRCCRLSSRRWRGSGRELGCLGRRGRFGGRGRRCCRRLAATSRRFIELAKNSAESNDIAFLVRTPDEYSARCRGHLDGYLIGFELDDGFTGRYRFSFLLQPARNGGFDDRLTERWNLDRNHAGKGRSGTCCDVARRVGRAGE